MHKDALHSGRANLRCRRQALARSELQRAAQQAELDEVAADLASRGPDVGARRVFGSSFLDRLEERYQDAEGAGEAVPRSPGARSAESARGSSGTYIVPAPTDPKIWCCRMRRTCARAPPFSRLRGASGALPDRPITHPATPANPPQPSEVGREGGTHQLHHVSAERGHGLGSSVGRRGARPATFTNRMRHHSLTLLNGRGSVWTDSVRAHITPI